MTNARNKLRSRGFTLYEVLIAIGVMMLAINLSVELFRVNFKLVHQTELLTATTSGIDSALYHLRQDTWGSGRIVVGDPKSVALTQDDGKQIVWGIDADGTLKRNAGGVVTQWPVAKGWTFATNGAFLTISEGKSLPERSAAAGSVELVSQLLLLSQNSLPGRNSP